MATRRDLERLKRDAQRASVRREEAEVVLPGGGIVEFATSPEFLGVDLFPLQATILKVATLDRERFTDFDYDAIGRWGSGFVVNDDPDQPAYQGRKGTTPDLLDRIDYCLAAGRSGCEELLLVLGRRGSKSYDAAILVVWRLWNILALGDPQAHYGIPRDKKLTVHLFAADQGTLVRNGYADVVNLLAAPCFEPFLGRSTGTMISLLTPAQLGRGARPGVTVGNVQVVAAPTTSTAVRGPAVPVVWLDEFGHVNGAGSTADSIEIYTAASPALAQFPLDAMTIQTSTPMEKLGQFYASYTKARRVDPVTGGPLAPTVFMFQLPSDELYLHADVAEGIEMWPGGPCFSSGLVPKITRGDIEDRRIWDPRGVEIEYEAQFAAAVNAYLLPDKVVEAFGPYKGARLANRDLGLRGVHYVAHVDPGKTEANYGVTVGHLTWEGGLPHVVVDYIHAWRPQDFPGGTVDYIHVERELLRLLSDLRISTMVFDQYSSIGTIQKLRADAQAQAMDWRPHIYERPASAGLNWKSAEVFKKAIHLGPVHMPPNELAQRELEHLIVVGQKVSAPTSGEIQTDDLADCLIGMTYTLLQEHLDVFNDLSRFRSGASLRGGLPLRLAEAADPISGLRAFTASQSARTRGHHNPARGIRTNR
ncbi:MAG: hypothetical protein WD895_00925 [Acidimicrobiia bacterium]